MLADAMHQQEAAINGPKAVLLAAADPHSAAALINLLDSPALRILLQHPNMQEAGILCRLLAAAKGMAAAAHASCKGQIIASCIVYRHEASFVAWLQHHAVLLMSMSLELPVDLPLRRATGELDKPSAAANIARALQHTANSASMQIQSFSCGTAYCNEILEQLSGSLTRLKLTDDVFDRRFAASSKTHDCQRADLVAAALRSLTGLQQLCLYPAALLPAVSSLPHLTLVDLPSVQFNMLGLLVNLPVTLKQLQLAMRNQCWSTERTALQLQHLTALTSILFSATDKSPGFGRDGGLCGGPGLVLKAEDVLPPNLQVLDVAADGCCLALQGLTQLQHCRLEYFTGPEGGITDIAASLPGQGQLQGPLQLAVALHCSYPGVGRPYLAADMPGFAALQIPGIRHLTHLELDAEDLIFDDNTADAFAKALQQLTSLVVFKTFNHQGIKYWNEDNVYPKKPASKAATAEWQRALEGLPHLSSLVLNDTSHFGPR